MRTNSLLLVGLLLSLSGCTIEAKGLGAGRAQSSLISGRVFDSEQNAPVKGATVKTSDGTTATTDDNGNFTIEASPGKSVLSVEEADHAHGVKEVTVYADAESYVEVFAKPVTKDRSLNGIDGGTVKVGEVTLDIPPDGLETEDGVPYTGQVTIEVATVRPERARELSAFPGKFDGTLMNGMSGSVATRSAAAIHLRNAAGRPLRLRQGAQVEVFMPIRSAISQRNTRMWKLRDETADWEEAEFQAVRTVDPMTNEPALRSAVTALTWWNAGEPFLKSRIQGCLSMPSGGGTVGRVDAGTDTPDPPIAGSGGADGTAGAGGAFGADAGAPRMAAPLIGDSPLAGIQVVATGIGYGYFTEHYTNAEGCFDIEVKANDAVAVYAHTRVLRSQARRIVALGPGETHDVGMIGLGARAGDCPGVMEDCGEGCVDTLSDDNNCGGCGNGCFGEGPLDPLSTLVPYHCVYGSCGCDARQDDCGGSCADIETDVANCGACGNDCISNGEGTECTDSACVSGDPTVCESGFVMCSDGSCADPAVGCSSSMTCSRDPITGAMRTLCPGSFGDPAMCIDTDNDVNNCGGCAPDVASAAGPRCYLSPDITLGQMGCSTGCTTESECQALLECGDTGQTACATPTGGIYCADLNSNAQFCGNCQTSCAPEESCTRGACMPRVCPTGQAPCGYFCRDIALSCGEQCAQGAACIAGLCSSPN